MQLAISPYFQISERIPLGWGNWYTNLKYLSRRDNWQTGFWGGNNGCNEFHPVPSGTGKFWCGYLFPQMNLWARSMPSLSGRLIPPGLRHRLSLCERVAFCFLPMVNQTKHNNRDSSLRWRFAQNDRGWFCHSEPRRRRGERFFI